MSGYFPYTETPSIEEVTHYFTSTGGSTEQAQKFWNKYESLGWMIGISKIKNWRPLANNFIANYISINHGSGGLSGKQTTAGNINSIAQAFANIQRDMDATGSER